MAPAVAWPPAGQRAVRKSVCEPALHPRGRGRCPCSLMSSDRVPTLTHHAGRGVVLDGPYALRVRRDCRHGLPQRQVHSPRVLEMGDRHRAGPRRRLCARERGPGHLAPSERHARLARYARDCAARSPCGPARPSRGRGAASAVGGPRAARSVPGARRCCVRGAASATSLGRLQDGVSRDARRSCRRRTGSVCAPTSRVLRRARPLHDLGGAAPRVPSQVRARGARRSSRPRLPGQACLPWSDR